MRTISLLALICSYLLEAGPVEKSPMIKKGSEELDTLRKCTNDGNCVVEYVRMGTECKSFWSNATGKIDEKCSIKPRNDDLSIYCFCKKPCQSELLKSMRQPLQLLMEEDLCLFDNLAIRNALSTQQKFLECREHRDLILEMNELEPACYTKFTLSAVGPVCGFDTGGIREFAKDVKEGCTVGQTYVDCFCTSGCSSELNNWMDEKWFSDNLDLSKECARKLLKPKEYITCGTDDDGKTVFGRTIGNRTGCLTKFQANAQVKCKRTVEVAHNQESGCVLKKKAIHCFCGSDNCADSKNVRELMQKVSVASDSDFELVACAYKKVGLPPPQRTIEEEALEQSSGSNVWLIVVIVVVLLLLLVGVGALAAFFIVRRKKKKRSGEKEEDSADVAEPKSKETVKVKKSSGETMTPPRAKPKRLTLREQLIEDNRIAQEKRDAKKKKSKIDVFDKKDIKYMGRLHITTTAEDIPDEMPESDGEPIEKVILDNTGHELYLFGSEIEILEDVNGKEIVSVLKPSDKKKESKKTDKKGGRN